MHKKDAVVPHRQLCTNYPDGFTYPLTAALSLCHVESALDYAKFLPPSFCAIYTSYINRSTYTICLFAKKKVDIL